MRIKFLSEQIFETGGPKKGPKFPAGFVLDESAVGSVLGTEVTPDYAKGFLQRWIGRGVAIEVDGRSHPGAAEEVTTAGVQASAAAQPLGTNARGRPTVGLDDGKQVPTPGNSEAKVVDPDPKGKK